MAGQTPWEASLGHLELIGDKIIMKKKELEKSLLVRINALLELNLSNEERAALVKAKLGLEKSSYLPGIVDGLRNELTPLAMQQKLSTEVKKLYLDITNHKYMNKNLGGGLFSVWSSSF